MIVCQCNMLSDTAIRDAAVEHAPPRVSQVYACLGCRAECGRCTATVVSILREAASSPLLEELPAMSRLKRDLTSSASGVLAQL